MTSKTEQDVRRRAWNAARRAVRSYSRNPSELNEARMRRAWLRLRVVRERAPASPAQRAAPSPAGDRGRNEPRNA